MAPGLARSSRPIVRTGTSFQRFAVMRYWRLTESIPFETFLSPDELHMNDWSYGCVAKLLAAAISEAAMRPSVTAGATVPR